MPTSKFAGPRFLAIMDPFLCQGGGGSLLYGIDSSWAMGLVLVAQNFAFHLGFEYTDSILYCIKDKSGINY